jgi:hypothetical protein
MLVQIHLLFHGEIKELLRRRERVLDNTPLYPVAGNLHEADGCAGIADGGGDGLTFGE